jgi:hypothetical protein
MVLVTPGDGVLRPGQVAALLDDGVNDALQLGLDIFEGI